MLKPHDSSSTRSAARALGPAAQQQQPNLGADNPAFTTFYFHSNMTPQNSARGHQGGEKMGMLDLVETLLEAAMSYKPADFAAEIRATNGMNPPLVSGT